MAVFDKLARLGDKVSSGARRLLQGDDEDLVAADEAEPPPAMRRADLPAALHALGIDEGATLAAARAAYRAKARPLVVVQTSGAPDAQPAAERLAALEDALAVVEEALLPLPKR
jgi:hypothetical protein